MRYILSVVILLSFAFAAAAEPQQILERARKTMESLPPLAMKVETEISGDMMPDVSRHITEQRWDGKRFDCTLKEERVNRRDKKTQDYWAARSVWNGEQWVARADALNTPQNDRNVVKRWIARAKALNRRQNHRNVVTGTSPVDAENSRKCRQRGGILYGRLYTDQDVIALLQAAHPQSQQQEMIGDATCEVISGDTPTGKITLWLDASKGYAVRRALMEKKAGDILFEGEKMSGEGVATIELKDVQVQQFDSHWIPVSGTMVYRSDGPDGSEVLETCRTVRSDIRIDPDFQAMGAFVMDDIADGTRVRDEDAPDIVHIWYQGQVLTKSDPRTKDR